MSKKLRLCVPIALTFGFVASAQAGGACSAHRAVGVYILKCSGTAASLTGEPITQPMPEGSSFPVAELSLQVRHKDGTVSGNGTLSLGGIVGAHGYTEQVTVNQDCTISETVTQTFNNSPLPTATFYAVIGTDGRQIESISTSLGNTLLCTATRVDNPESE